MTVTSYGSSSRLCVLAWPARKNSTHNPYQKLLYDSVEETGFARVSEFDKKAAFNAKAPDILHIHWPDAFLAAGAGWRFWPRYIALRFYLDYIHLRGTKIVWTAHNLRRAGQRNSERMDRYFWPWFLRRLDGVIFMTDASARQARKTEPALATLPFDVIPHGHYKPVLPAETRLDAPRMTTPEAIFFGSITAYKNAWLLLQSFLDLPAGTARLHICGKPSTREPDERLEGMLLSLPPDKASAVRIDARFLSDDALATAIREADLAVFPYKDVLNSGAAIFALSAGRPILASDTALFRELQNHVGPQWVMLISGPLDGKQLAQALQRARALRLDSAIPDLSRLDWEEIGQRTTAFYHRLVETEDNGR